MNPSRVAVALLCIFLLTEFAAGSAAANADAPAVQTSGVIKAEDVLSASFNMDDIRHLFRKPDLWWPSFPEFNTGLTEIRSGERCFVSQNFKRVGGSSDGKIENALMLFDTEASAVQAFQKLVNDDAGNGRAISGPSVGDECRYFSRFESDNVKPYSTSVRFRVGEIVGNLTMLREMAGDSTDRLAGLAAPMVSRARAVLKGELRAAPMPVTISRHMPRQAGDMELLGASAVRIDAWALHDEANDPVKVRAMLQGLGLGEIGFARYRIRTDPSQVVEVVLFPFDSAKSATSWVRDFISDKDSGTQLDAGRTGVLSAFVNRPVPPGNGDYENIYELQFAKGAIVGDVSCYSPYGKTSCSCESAVRELAESWYGELE